MNKFESASVYEDRHVRVFGYTDSPKSHNDDGYMYVPYQGLALLADGSSSSNNARAAVRAGMGSLIHSLGTVWLEPRTYRPILKQAMRDASAAVGENAPGSWTTMVAARFQIDKAGKIDTYIASVGDSRAYFYHPSSGLKQLTQDHNLLWSAAGFSDLEKLEMTNRINSMASIDDFDNLSDDEQYFFETQNWVTQLLGEHGLKYPKPSSYPIKTSRVLQPRIVRERLVKGSKLLLISDGCLVLSTAEIEDITANASNPAEELVKKSIPRMVNREPDGKWHVRSTDTDDATALLIEAL